MICSVFVKDKDESLENQRILKALKGRVVQLVPRLAAC